MCILMSETSNEKILAYVIGVVMYCKYEGVFAVFVAFVGCFLREMTKRIFTKFGMEDLRQISCRGF
jgi:hypothetical protein